MGKNSLRWIGRAPLLAIGLAVAAAAGCSGQPGGPSTASTSTEAARAAVREFLDAIKRGDDTAARSLLTEIARKKTTEMGLAIAPPVAATASYSIGDCEAVGDTGEIVHVASTWTDTDSDGFTSVDEVIWAVRLDPEGWRVVGMATKVFEDAPPLLLNFEDPEDMLAKQEQLAQEIQRRAKAAGGQEPQPVRTGDSRPERAVE
jgi:hypothetical protein